MEEKVTQPVIDFTTYVDESTHNFTGREWVFKKIDAWLADPQAGRFFLLTGKPGSGKTAIAGRLSRFAYPPETTLPPRGENSNREAGQADDPVFRGTVLKMDDGDYPHLRPGFLSAIHFCLARDRRWIDPRTFAESLAKQLAIRYATFARALLERSGDQQIIINIEQHVERGRAIGIMVEQLNITRVPVEEIFNRIVREPLEDLCFQEADQQIVILVDALDESLAYSGDVHIASLLAQIEQLPKNVRFILTSRQDARVVNEFLGADELFLSSSVFEQDNQDDVLRYLETRVRYETRLAPQAKRLDAQQMNILVETISHRAEGNFLYIIFLLDAMAKGLRSLTDLEGLPEGLDALYFESLKRVVRQGTRNWRTDYQPVMGVLSVTKESLTLAQLQGFSGLPESTLWNYLGDLQQFIEEIKDQREQGRDQEGRYRLYHQSVIDFLHRRTLVDNDRQLRNDFYVSEQEWHRNIANACESGELAPHWKTVWNTPIDQGRWRYAQQHYITHLYQAQEWQRLFTVLDEGEYGRAKIKHDFNTLAYARDLELGQQAILRNELSSEEKIGLLPALWRYGLLRASLVTQADNYPDLAFLVMVMLKQYQKALAVVELISDDHRKARIFIDIGVKLEEQGQKELAQWTMAQARAVMVANMQSDPTIVQTILQEIAQVRPFALEIPFLDEIETTTKLIEHEEQRASVLVAVAVALSLAEAREKAEELACTIPYTALVGETRVKIVETLVEAKLWESATLIAQSITDDQPARNSALAKVIIGLLGVQAWEKARELALTTDLSVRWKAMAEIVLNRVLVEPQMADQLLKELAFIALPDDRKHASRVISQIWARAHQWDKAINTLQHMYDNTYDSLNTWAASQALEQMLRAQQWDKAIELASSLPDSFSQLVLLKSLVEALIDAEQVERERDAIAKVIRAISRREQDDEILLEVVTLLIKLQLWNEAQQVTEQIEYPKQQCQALAAIADAFFQEQSARAHQLILRAESIIFSLKKPDEESYGNDPERIGSTLCTVVGVLARMQLWGRAIALATTLSARWSTSDRDEAFAAIVVASGRAKAWEQAISIAQNIEDDEEQSNALKAVVEDLLYLQEWQRALEVTQTIKQRKLHFEALFALMKRLMFVQKMSLRDRTAPPGTEDELPLIPFDVQLSEEEEQLWDDIIASAQQLFDTYRSPKAVIEMLYDLAMAQQWDKISKIVDIPALAEYRAELLVVIVGYMLGVDQWDSAEALARSIDAPVQKAEALAGLAAVHIEEQPLKAEALLNEALAVVQAVTDDELDKSETFASLAFQLNKAERWEKALAIARSIDRSYDRVKVLVAIATARIDPEPEQSIATLSEALAFIRSQNVDDQGGLLEDIAKVLPRLLAVKQSHVLCAEFLSSIAMGLKSYENVEPVTHLEALAAAVTSTEQEEQDRALAEFEVFLGELNTTHFYNPYAVKDSDEEAQDEETEEEDSFGWRGRSRKQEKKDQRLRSEVWSSMQDGQPEQAADVLLEHMVSKDYFNEAEWSILQRDVAGDLARKLQWEKALAIVWSIGREWQKTQALEAIAKALVEAGQRDKARLLLVEAEAKAHSIEDGRERDDALRDVAITLAQIQEPDEAQVVVGFINDSMHREVPRLWITHALARAQRWDEAKEEARRLEGSLKISAMQSITDAMITYGEYEQALQYIQTAWIQAETRRELIKLLPLAEEFIPLHPELGEAFYDAFAWVDHFLQA